MVTMLTICLIYLVLLRYTAQGHTNKQIDWLCKPVQGPNTWLIS